MRKIIGRVLLSWPIVLVLIVPFIVVPWWVAIGIIGISAALLGSIWLGFYLLESTK